MYTDRNFKTKKEFIQAVAAGGVIRLYAPGLGAPKADGVEFVEGPHYPAPHQWYAKVEMKDGIVISVK